MFRTNLSVWSSVTLISCYRLTSSHQVCGRSSFHRKIFAVLHVLTYHAPQEMLKPMSMLHAGQRSRAAQQADGLVVVGGGLAGLAAAAALTRVAGVQRVSVLERSSAAAFGDEQAGAAAQLGPNGLRALRFIGGDETLAAVRSAGTDLAGTAIHPGGGAAVMLIPDPAKADTGLPQVLTPPNPNPS